MGRKRANLEELARLARQGGDGTDLGRMAPAERIKRLVEQEYGA